MRKPNYIGAVCALLLLIALAIGLALLRAALPSFEVRIPQSGHRRRSA
jgi:hypothetical protein